LRLGVASARHAPRRYPLAVIPIACATISLGGGFWLKREAMVDSIDMQQSSVEIWTMDNDTGTGKLQVILSGGGLTTV
jgi:hypothetical protein